MSKATEEHSGYGVLFCVAGNFRKGGFMCGRYFIDEGMTAEISRVTGIAETKLRISTGDVHPSETAPVIRTLQGTPVVEGLAWGFPGRQGRGLLINARAETALEKSMFRESVRRRRCVVPARKFYEWNRQKEMAVFEQTDRGILYMAGFYDYVGQRERFVLLTTAANASVSPVHDRMPLILDAEECFRWLEEPAAVEELLKKQPQKLKRYQEYEQQTFSFL